MTQPDCTHCHMKITKIQRKGLKCIKCPVWIHQSCAALPMGHEIWTCIKCKRQSSSTSNRSSLNSRVSTGTGSSSSSVNLVSTSNSVTNLQLMNEIKEIKSLTAALIDRMSALEGSHCQEMRLVRLENFELLKEIRDLKEHLFVKSTSDTEPVPMVHPRFNSYVKEVSPTDPEMAPPILEPVPSYLAVFDPPGPSKNMFLSKSNATKLNLVNDVDDHTAPQLAAVASRKWISVSNLLPSTNDVDVIQFISKKIKSSNGEIVCSKITPRSIAFPTFSSFKIGVPIELFESVLNSQFWPDNASVKEFLDYKTSGTKDFRGIGRINSNR